MFITRLAAILLVGLSMITPVLAEETDPKVYFPENSRELLELIDGCEDDSCMSYVSGAIGGIAIYAMISEKPSPFCTRGEVGKNDIRDAIVDTIKSTDALLDQHPSVSILTAFSRYWPCMTAEEIEALQSTALMPVDPQAVETLRTSDQHAIVFGDLDAPMSQTLLVFYDPNCAHCRRFRSVTDELAQSGWKIQVYPVATSSEESAGYGAVEIALRDTHPQAAEALYRHDPDGIADITLAMKIAESEGVPTRDILTAIARSGAYKAVENNTQTFFEMDAKGTPSWIIGASLYSGYLGADAIKEIGASFSGEEDYHNALGDELSTEAE